MSLLCAVCLSWVELRSIGSTVEFLLKITVPTGSMILVAWSNETGLLDTLLGIRSPKRRGGARKSLHQLEKKHPLTDEDAWFRSSGWCRTSPIHLAKQGGAYCSFYVAHSSISRAHSQENLYRLAESLRSGVLSSSSLRGRSFTSSSRSPSSTWERLLSSWIWKFLTSSRKSISCFHRYMA